MSVTAKQVRQTLNLVKGDMSCHGREALENALESEQGFLLLPQSAISKTLALRAKDDIPTVILSLDDWKKLTGSEDNLPPFPIGTNTNFSQMLIVYPDRTAAV